MDRKRLAVLTTHPIQYQAPWLRALAAHPEIELQVFFCHQATPRQQAEAGFGVEFDWDLPLLEGYPYRFLRNVARTPTVATFNGLDTPEIKEIIAGEWFDAVLVCGWHYKSAWQAMRTCWRTRTRVMARSDSHLRTPRHQAKKALKWPLYRWFIPRLDACLAAGEWSKEYFLHYGARPENVYIVPHVVDTDFFRREAARLLPSRGALRANWGLDEDAVVYLFAGKFVNKKRPLDFVRAVNMAARYGYSVAGLMVGDGPLRAACEEFAANHSAPVRFAGFMNQSEICRAYVAADALVLPSDGGETWGVVVNEAMACGRPCIVSDHVGAGPDLVVSRETGAVFPLGRADLLANLIGGFARDRSLLQRMSERALVEIKRHSSQAAAESTVAVVRQVAQRRARRNRLLDI